ncbi:MAG: hypothetical protein EZS28_054462, partial [Streblomastix strix]
PIARIDNFFYPPLFFDFNQVC